MGAACKSPDASPGTSPAFFQGIASVGYTVANLDSARTWYTKALGVEPYFDEAYYVGFRVGTAELGLDPDTSIVHPGAGGAIPYWQCADVEERFAALIALGAKKVAAVQDVGGGIKVASVLDPFGNSIGLIQLP